MRKAPPFAFAIIPLLLLGAGCVNQATSPVTPSPSDLLSPPLAESPTTGGGCRATGCSGQVCSDEDVMTTCEYREEYSCYATATCERQANGDCGWTETSELTSCLEGARG